MHRFRVKGCEEVRGIGLETEELAPPARPFRAGRMRLVRRQGARHDASIAEAVKDRLASVDLDPACDVRMMPDHDVAPCIDRSMGERALVRCEPGTRVHDALVERNDDDVRAGACAGDVARHLLERRGIDALERRRRSDGPAVTALYAHVCAAGPLIRCPGELGAHAVVAQQRDAAIRYRNDRRLARGSDIRAGSCVVNGRRIERLNGVLDARRSAVGDVVARERDRLESRAGKRGHVRRIGAGSGNVAFALDAPGRVRHLEMADGEIDTAQRRRDAAQPVIGIRLVEHQIACEGELERRRLRIRHCVAFGSDGRRSGRRALIVDAILHHIVRNPAAGRGSASRGSMQMRTASRSKKRGAARTETVPVGVVVEWIRERIRRGRFVPGQRLVEADIMRELHASRSRVREALKRLETEGLVTIEEFRGASVKYFTRDEVRQMYRARMVLEGLAAADFAAADAPELKRRLARLQEELNSLEHTGDHERFARLNDEWHRLIIEGSGNEYVRTFVERLRIPIYRLLFTGFYNAKRIDQANAGHRRVTEAILKGRPKAAERFMREHIAEGLGAISRLKDAFE